MVKTEALIEFNSNGQKKSFPKIHLGVCKISENVYDHVPSVVGPTSYTWNFTKIQKWLWKLNKPLIELQFK